MTPTMYGLDNTILYIPNGVFDASFDGWPTFIAFAASLVTYVAIALRHPARADPRARHPGGRGSSTTRSTRWTRPKPEPDLVKADAGPQ